MNSCQNFRSSGGVIKVYFWGGNGCEKCKIVHRGKCPVYNTTIGIALATLKMKFTIICAYSRVEVSGTTDMIVLIPYAKQERPCQVLARDPSLRSG